MSKSAKELKDELGLDAVITGQELSLKQYSGELTQILTRTEVFSPEECKKIIETYREKVAPAKIIANGEAAVDPDWRLADQTYIFPDGEEFTVEILDRLMTIVLTANLRYEFDVDAFESVQVIRYPEGGHYSWHKDLGTGHTSHRKISLSLQLSAPEDYEGGGLEIDLHSKVFTAPRDPGTVVVFPSWERHRVLPVTKGERWAIVAWAVGSYRFR